MVYTFNPSTWEAEAGRSLWVQGQPGLQSEFQYSWGHTENLSLEKQNKKGATNIGEKLDAYILFVECKMI